MKSAIKEGVAKNFHDSNHAGIGGRCDIRFPGGGVPMFGGYDGYQWISACSLSLPRGLINQ